jgi:hypothetical protein
MRQRVKTGKAMHWISWVIIKSGALIASVVVAARSKPPHLYGASGSAGR